MAAIGKANMNIPESRGSSVPEEPFERIRLLGTGGFARTWQVRVIDDDLREEFGTDEVAIKSPLSKEKERTLKHELELNAVLHQRVKKLHALNIARYLGFTVFDRKIVMVMEYCSGGSLRARIGKIGFQKPMPATDAVRIVKGVLNGLASIHREHIFHRDIKPENILFDGDVPKVADLGISRMLEANDFASTAMGTFPYMSPEILGPEGASFPSDIWSLGVTLYEMVTGRLPFGDKTTPIKTMVHLICSEAHVPAYKVREDVPRELSAIIDHSLHKDPSNRYGTAEQMFEALCRFERGEDAGPDRKITMLLDSLRSQGCTDSVEEQLRQLAVKHPQEPKVYQALGEFYNRCMRHSEAISTFKKGLQLSPDNALLYWDMAMAYQSMRKRVDAARCLERAIALGLDPSFQRHAAALLMALRGGRNDET